MGPRSCLDCQPSPVQNLRRSACGSPCRAPARGLNLLSEGGGAMRLST
jgi:hypothetical protein